MEIAEYIWEPNKINHISLGSKNVLVGVFAQALVAPFCVFLSNSDRFHQPLDERHSAQLHNKQLSEKARQVESLLNSG